MNRMGKMIRSELVKKSRKKSKKSKFPTTPWPSSAQSLSGGSEPWNTNI